MALKRGKRTEHELEDLLNAVELELGIHLSILDCHAVLRRPDGASLIAPHRLSRNHIPVCGNQLSQLCKEECVFSLDQRAQQDVRPFVVSCWKQLIELAVPIRNHGD